MTGAWQAAPLQRPPAPAGGRSLCIQPPSSPVCPQVLFKMVLGSAKFGEAALFLSIVGSANFVLVSCVPIILYFTRVEYIGSPADIPWTYLCGVAGLLFGINNHFTGDRADGIRNARTIIQTIGSS